jgi:DNA-binding NtrC family response regulator
MYNEKNNKHITGITPQAKDLLLNHHWPGNVRELANLIERAIVLSVEDIIDLTDLDPFVGRRESGRGSFGDDLSLEDLEKKAIIEALKRTGGSLKDAAELLGIHRNTIRLKISKYNIEV